MSNKPICTNCKHHGRVPFIPGLGGGDTCFRPIGRATLVDGKRHGLNKSCWDERVPHRWWHRRTRCGTEAIWFDPKEPE